VLHGYEVCLATGRPFSSFHTGQQKARPFRIVKVGLTRDREIVRSSTSELISASS